MSKTTKLTALAAQVEELTKTQNRIDEFDERLQVLETGIPSPTRDFPEDELDLIVENQINQLSTAVANKRKALDERIERQASQVAKELEHGFAN